MIRISVLLSTLSVAIGAVLAAPFAYAAPVSLHADTSRITFASPRGAPAYQLRITGPGPFLVERVFLANEAMSVSFSANGSSWQDGSYNYELAPVLGVSMRDERAAGGSRTQRGEIDSGTFALLRGRVLIPTLVPESERSDQDSIGGTKDQVIPDDLIVQGSTCVGLDCVNNESFGFDTIRMKENNLRIKFDDTSASAGFPATDWQLTANDSASGGLNKFSIDDVTAATTPFTVEGATPNNSLYVDSSGNVGFGTSTPALDLHVQTSDTPAIRMDQTNAGGFTAQTWDIGANEANFFVRDLTGGSRLSLRIRPGAPTSSVDIAANGNVGMGTASPASELHIVRANNGPTISMESTGTPARTWQMVVRDSDGNFAINDIAASAAEFILDGAGNLTIRGSLTASGSTFPDYVFEPSYKLMPLEQLERFIDSNGHLPNIPSARQVEAAGGHNMTELQLKLLEKVEELTLYTLQQQDRIDRLEAKLEQAGRSSPRRVR